MITGNPRTGRRVTILTLALVVAIVLTGAYLLARKRTAPQNEPPLHPSVLMIVLWGLPQVRINQRLELGDTLHSWARALAASDRARFSAVTYDSEAVALGRCAIGLR